MKNTSYLLKNVPCRGLCVAVGYALCIWMGTLLLLPFHLMAGEVFSFEHISQNQSSTQERLIRGNVRGEKGEPLIGVTIVEAETNNGVLSDVNGNFQIRLQTTNAVLSFSYIGFDKQRITIGNQSFIQVVLQSSRSELREVVVVGFGTQRKETVTGAINTANVDDLLQAPVSSVSNAIIGRVTGITSTQASGEPGRNSATLRIRGISTMNSGSQEPLIIIDGVQSNFSVLNAIDPHEIDALSVLKDASATAVYGVKGANGVIIVTTKRGKSGAPKVSLSYNYGTTQLATKMGLLNSYDYALFRNEAVRLDNDPSMNKLIFSEDELWKFQNNRDYTPQEVEAMSLSFDQKQALLNSPAIFYTSHDFFNEQFGGNAPQSQLNINISGGSDKVNYFTSVGYLTQDGVFKHTDYHNANVNSYFRRYNFRSNFDFQMNKNWELGVNLAAIYTQNGGILGGEQDGDITQAYSRQKAMTVMILSGTPFIGPGIIDNKLVGYYTKNNNPLASKGAMGWSPITHLLTRPYLENYNTNLNANVKLKHTMAYLLQGLSLTGTVSYNDAYSKSVRIDKTIPVYTVTRNPANPAELLFFGGETDADVVRDNFTNYKWRRYYFETALNYEQSFDEHLFTALLLANAQKTYDPYLLYNVPAGLIGMASRLTYRYDDRYLAELNMGYNGSENFPKGKRFGFFPALSIGWILTNEKFFRTNNTLTYLKIRGSYGEVGNDQVGGRRFLYLPSTWGYGWNEFLHGYYFGHTNGSTKSPFYSGAWETAVGNPNVTWERARKTNIGLEMNLLKNRFTFVGDLFYEKRSNILWTLGTVPAIVGSELPNANIGRVNNRGFEVQLGWNDIVSDFQYGIRFNVSYAKNTIEYIAEPNYEYSWMNATGYSIGQYKGYLTDGFYNTNEEAQQHTFSTIDANRVQAGDLRYVDFNGDGILDTKDIVPIGYSNYPRYTFSSALNFGYKGFALSLLFTGSAQGSIPLDFYTMQPFYREVGAAMKYQYEGRWTPEKVQKGIKPTFPRASLRTGDNINGAVFSDFWLQSTDHIRLKNIELSYQIQNLTWLSSFHVHSIRLYANGNNLYTWSKMIPGYDPEQQDSGGAASGYLYPMTRVFNFGINVQF